MPLDANGIHNSFYIVKLDIAQSIHSIVGIRSPSSPTLCGDGKAKDEEESGICDIKIPLISIAMSRVGICREGGEENSLKRESEDERRR